MALENVIIFFQRYSFCGGDVIIRNSRAWAKIHSVVLVAVIVFACVGGVVIYFLLGGQEQSFETIKIGFIGDLQFPGGKYGLRTAEWAIEQINAKGGVLGKSLEIVAEDSDFSSSGGNPAKTAPAITKLITHHKVDFILGAAPPGSVIVSQDICALHKKIYLDAGYGDLHLTQRVADNYDKYKYYFRCVENQTVEIQALVNSVITLREYSGFNKIALLSDYFEGLQEGKAMLETKLPEYGFEIVYTNSFEKGTGDFTSYLAAIEAAGAEILVPYTSAIEGIPLLKEWCERQSPTVVWGHTIWVSGVEGWDRTEDKCKYTAFFGGSTRAFNLGYAITNKTLPTRNAYIERWGEDPRGDSVNTYDAIYILCSALERAGTTETDEVIQALEETSMETCKFPRFAFTSSHDSLVREEDYSSGICTFLQFQSERKIVPVYPKEMMEEAGATYIYPHWSGPWD